MRKSLNSRIYSGERSKILSALSGLSLEAIELEAEALTNSVFQIQGRKWQCEARTRKSRGCWTCDVWVIEWAVSKFGEWRRRLWKKSVLPARPCGFYRSSHHSLGTSRDTRQTSIGAERNRGMARSVKGVETTQGFAVILSKMQLKGISLGERGGAQHNERSVGASGVELAKAQPRTSTKSARTDAYPTTFKFTG